jgi:hemolysin activation/secretion protein
MAVDEFSFGNYTIVRGYDPGAAAGDSAIAAAFDISGFQQTFWNQRVSAELTGFYDLGKYWNQDSTGTQERSIASIGGGVRVTLTGYLRADVTYAVPLNAPLGQGEGRPDPRVLFSITADTAAIWERIANVWAS